jgi:ABC-type phosphonate transport system ATPase subunit
VHDWARRQVNLLSVIDEMAGTFSGGMKRRLSVAISMIGNPLCCYLVPPAPPPSQARSKTSTCTIVASI